MVGNLFQVILQRRPFMYVVRDLREKYGPIFTMRMGQRTLVIVTDADLIHDALVKQGPMFASRPADSPIRLLFSVGKCTVNSAPYGPLWRALRRNFVAEIVSPQRVKGFSWIREWAMAMEQRAGSALAVALPAAAVVALIVLCCCCCGYLVAGGRRRPRGPNGEEVYGRDGPVVRYGCRGGGGYTGGIFSMHPNKPIVC